MIKKNILKNLKNKQIIFFKILIVIFILIVSILLNFNNFNSNLVIADSILIQENKDGQYKNISLETDGNLVLSSYEKYFLDDFFDTTKIKLLYNVELDPNNNQIKLKVDDLKDNSFNKTFGGNKYDDFYDCDLTSDGGFILVGTTDTYDNDYYNLFLVKTDKNGFETWNKTYGGNSPMMGYAIKETSDGGYIITGTGPTSESQTYPLSIILMKMDKNGNLMWNKTYNSKFSSGGFDIIETLDEGYIIAGSRIIKTDKFGNVEWTNGHGGYSIRQTRDFGYIVAGGLGFTLSKLFPNGTVQWTKSFASHTNDESRSVLQTTDGNFVVAGFTNDPDSLLIKTDNNGNKLWEKSFGIYNTDKIFSMEQTFDKGYILCGVNSLNPSTGLWVIKTNCSGIKEWEKITGGSQVDQGHSIKQTYDGDFVSVGATGSYGMGGTNAWLIYLDNIEPYNAGTLISKNIVENPMDSPFETFSYDTNIPIDTFLDIQFSKNKIGCIIH